MTQSEEAQPVTQSQLTRIRLNGANGADPRAEFRESALIPGISATGQ